MRLCRVAPCPRRTSGRGPVPASGSHRTPGTERPPASTSKPRSLTSPSVSGSAVQRITARYRAATLVLMRSHVEVLARAARAVHGTGEIADKLDWVTEEARAPTGASFAAFIGLGDRVDMVAAAGVPVGEIDRFARPALARLVRLEGGTAPILRSEDLALDRRHRRFLQRL